MAAPHVIVECTDHEDDTQNIHDSSRSVLRSPREAVEATNATLESPSNTPESQTAPERISHHQHRESENADLIDPILELLINLARFFRAQATLLREQAKILDESIIQHEIPGPDMDLDERLFHKRILHSVQCTLSSMLTAHDRIDALEDSLLPWQDTMYVLCAIELTAERSIPDRFLSTFSTD
jgi:hypothetical protein